MPLSTAPQHSSPLRLAYITQLDEIVSPKGGELVGQQVICPEKGTELGYREGHLEALAKAIQENRGGIGELIEIVAVIHTDTDKEMEGLGFDTDNGPRWPWPQDLPAANGRTLSQVTHQVPMYTTEWVAGRDRLRAAKVSGKTNLVSQIRQEMRAIRLARETAMSELLDSAGVNLALTDSTRYIFQPEMPNLRQLHRRPIVNIHPAILEGQTAIPGLYPTQSALLRYNEGIILGPGRSIIEVPDLKGYRSHGATLHRTSAEIDGGEIIYAYEDNDMIEPGMSQQELRHKSFKLSQKVLIDGLTQFARSMRPRLAQATRLAKAAGMR